MDYDMEQIRVGLIGAGGNTKSRHIPGFIKLKGIQLLSVATDNNCIPFSLIKPGMCRDFVLPPAPIKPTRICSIS